MNETIEFIENNWGKIVSGVLVIAMIWMVVRAFVNAPMIDDEHQENR